MIAIPVDMSKWIWKNLTRPFPYIRGSQPMGHKPLGGQMTPFQGFLSPSKNTDIHAMIHYNINITVMKLP